MIIQVAVLPPATALAARNHPVRTMIIQPQGNEPGL
jgi:hypothetical protein